MPVGKVWIYRLLFFILCMCNFVCLFLRLQISPSKVASNFARWFIGIRGRESHILVNFAPQKPKIGRQIGQHWELRLACRPRLNEVPTDVRVRNNESLKRATFFMSLPNIRMPPAGFCFTDVTFFFLNVAHHSTMGERITTWIAALTLSMKRLLRLQIWRTLVQ